MGYSHCNDDCINDDAPHIEAPTMTLLFLQHSLIPILLCTSNYLKSTVARMMWREMNVCTENPKEKKIEQA